MNYIARNQEDAAILCKTAADNQDDFWNDYAKNYFQWHAPWTKVSNCNLFEGKIAWFEDAKLNITENCIDRHLKENASKTAIIWEPNDPKASTIHISYQQLHDEVCKTANALKSLGIKKGDRICLYLPMIPELAYAVLACARIGAVHSVVFAGFSAQSLADRINDAQCNLLITADGGYRGNKTTPLKEIADEAVLQCPSINNVLVVKSTNEPINWQANNIWWHDIVPNQATICPATTMDAEDILFILYTSGSTGKPKGMVHTCAGYMVYTTFTFLNVFQYKPNQIYWCTADIGWITGHSYILYGPLSAGATSVMFEGVPTYPDNGKFWQIIEKHKVNIFYTAPTAIRALAQCELSFVEACDLSSLQVLGTVGEPINEEAWHWYDQHIGKGNCPIVDTWWQTETGGILISNMAGVTPAIPSFATLPMPGIVPVLMDTEGNELIAAAAEGNLCIAKPWPSMARTIYGNHQRFIETYYTAYPGKYFTGDGAKRTLEGNYRITGRVDDVVIVSGHNLGTAEIENCLDEHPLVAESAVVGYPHDIKGNAIMAYVQIIENTNEEQLKTELLALVAHLIGPIAKPDKIWIVNALPKTRSGKIMRRILRKIAEGDTSNLGDISTLLNPECVEELIKKLG